MIPSKPRSQQDILLVQKPEEMHLYHESAGYMPDVVITVGFHIRSQPLCRCLDSIVNQNVRNLKVLVIIGNDSKTDIADLVLQYRKRINITILDILAGKASQSRNMLLDYIDHRFGHSLWVARLDADDELASPDSLFQMVEQGETRQVDFVVGGNLLRANDEIVGENRAQSILKTPQALLLQLKSMADGTAQNELPSCNLLMRSHAGVRYPHHHSAEDHWLLTELLIFKNNQVSIATDVIYAIYSLNGITTYTNQSSNRYFTSRNQLFQTALQWFAVLGSNGKLLGYGNEGIVHLNDGYVIKQFYHNVLSDESANWLAGISKSGNVLPEYKMVKKEGKWQCQYPYETTLPFHCPFNIGQLETFLLSCLKHNLAPQNIKRDNLRITSKGTIQYVDIGNDLKPLTASSFLDISARLYAIGILNVPDNYIFRYPSTQRQHEVLVQLPGFLAFYKRLMTSYANNLLEKRQSRCLSSNNEVTLLIKCCAMDAGFVEAQIQHIVKGLETPTLFSKKVILIDSFEGPYLREYDKGDLSMVINICESYRSSGLIDEIWRFPKSDDLNQKIYQEWFNCLAGHSHTQTQIPVASQLWAFEKVETRYVLQCDLDVIIGRRDYQHDYLEEMVTALRSNEKAFSCGFNIPKEPTGNFEQYCAPIGSYVPEVRLGLLDLKRIKSQRPFPNSLFDGKLTTSWYRSIEQYQGLHGWTSLRGGSPQTFYIHPPNHVKKDHQFITRVRRLCEMGQVPASQYFNWDVVFQPDYWMYAKRHETIVFLIKGRNIPVAKINRCFSSLKMQDDQSFGMVIIDDCSNDKQSRHYPSMLGALQCKCTLIVRDTKVGRMPNFITGIKEVCQNPETLIVILDMDDALFSPKVVSTFKQKILEGHDLIQAGVFRIDKPLHQYRPNYTGDIRKEFGNDVWSHLRAFKKSLFDQIPESYFKMNGFWIEECTDYATMVPLVELAQKPLFIDQYYYFHERSTLVQDTNRKAEIIQCIIDKEPVGSNSAI